jgi:ferredoxin
VELRLLARMFTSEQAALASAMHLHRESADDIAARAGVAPETALATLKAMARKGLVQARRAPGGLQFGLLPFIVGSYEESLPYMDKEMAQLFEAMLQEANGAGILDREPAFHRVIPVEQSIQVDIEVLPYERVSELVDGARSWGVRECICRKQKALIGEGCEHERFNCINLAPVEGAFVSMPYVRTIDRDEAVRILRQTEDEGLVHCVYNQQNDLYYVCNCCPCCCGIMRGLVEFGQQHALATSDFWAIVDGDACTGCEACLERCHFHALRVDQGSCTVDLSRCMGCGLCASVCPSDALHLQRRAAAAQVTPPVDSRQWSAQRAASLGKSLEELL